MSRSIKTLRVPPQTRRHDAAAIVAATRTLLDGLDVRGVTRT
jgi:hypothetical protein